MRRRRVAAVGCLGVAGALGLAVRGTAVADPPEPAPETAWVVAPAGPGWGAVEVPAAPADLGALRAAGAALFARHCAACHGPGGGGDGVFAGDLPRAPRDLAREPLRTRSGGGAPAPGDVYRTLTVGAPAHGMPAFDHLTADARWALSAFVLSLPGAAAATGDPAAAVPPRPATLDLALGRTTFATSCQPCHGAAGAGDGPLAATFVDGRGRKSPPTDLTRGPRALRGGARVEDIARTIALGRPGSPMAPVPLPPDALWATAAFVAGLVADAQTARQAAWDALFHARRAMAAVDGKKPGKERARWDPATQAAFDVAPEGGAGCLACHAGVAPIATGAMALSIDAAAGGDPDRACAVCHAGRPAAATRAEAHTGLIANPGSLWVTSVGQGCGRCHSDHGALTSLLGLPLPEPTGGDLFAVRSRRTDPTGASGSNHAYRMQRALMAQETGKVFLGSVSAGLTGRDAPRFTDFTVDDPDGPVPCAGSDTYRAFMARAEAAGHLQRLDRGQGLPTFAEAQALLGGDPAAAAYVDTFRKECARCHLWGEGKDARGERRSSGCSACHVLNDIDGLALPGGDPTVPLKRPRHPLRHELVTAIPESQCNHCHTRGQETLHSEAHQVAGIGCVDCHTSIDVHGDGNIYASIPHQLEVRCEDCHGTATARPWELALGHGTPAAGERPRGTVRVGDVEHVVTSRGNARANWLREGDDVVVVSLGDGRRHVTPQLQRPPAAAPAPPPGATAAPVGSAHAPEVAAMHTRLQCAACHGSTGPRCGTCHVDYFPLDKAQDYLLSALDYDPATTRQRTILTPGAVEFRESGQTRDTPDFRRDEEGLVRPRIPGCEVGLTWLGERGKRVEFRPRMNPGGQDYPPHVAPSLPHEMSLSPRQCADCHAPGGGPPVFPQPRVGTSR